MCIVHCINSLLFTSLDWINYDVKVDELFFTVHTVSPTGYLEVEYDLNLLKSGLRAVAKLINVQNTKVHLMIGSERDESIPDNTLIAQLASLKSTNIVSLYFPGIKIKEKFATAIGAFENVRVLMMRSSENNKILASMPALEELYFDCDFQEKNFDDMYDTMRTTVGQAAKLKKMYVCNSRIPFTQFKFADLDRERMKLDGARKLKIYIDTEEKDATGALDDAERTFNHIEIVRISTEPTINPHLARRQHLKFRWVKFGKRDFVSTKACTPMLAKNS